MGNIFLASGGTDIDFMIKGIFPYRLFGQTVWITISHVCLLIIILAMVILMFIANRVMKKAREVPGGLQNVFELIVEMLDKLVDGGLGRFAPPLRNYIGTIFIFIWLCNTAGLFGLRNPTADYGTPLALAFIIVILVNVNEVKYNKISGWVKNLFEPVPLFLPMNLISKVSILVSLSLRLFANNLSGLILLAMVYVLLRPVAYAWPAALHFYFDVFSGSLQAYVFCMLSMSYINSACGGD